MISFQPEKQFRKFYDKLEGFMDNYLVAAQAKRQ
jgi:hypothetical protein